jgi:putative Holliday junction resolvase
MPLNERILALDFGDKRVGVAVTDPLNITAQGLPNLNNSPDIFNKIREIVLSYNVKEIVVGYPRNLNGTIGESARKVELFTESLKKHIDLPIVLWDEWLSTSEANRHLISADISRNKRKGLVDMVSAQLILQGYLESKGKGSEA